jgi:hypothetical protein
VVSALTGGTAGSAAAHDGGASALAGADDSAQLPLLGRVHTAVVGPTVDAVVPGRSEEGQLCEVRAVECAPSARAERPGGDSADEAERD